MNFECCVPFFEGEQKNNEDFLCIDPDNDIQKKHVFYLLQEGATLLHYAVRTASIDTVKILLLYNVDINLADDVSDLLMYVLLHHALNKVAGSAK